MPVEFSGLNVRGYRRLRNVKLDIAPFNVFIGTNGVGKSSILEVVGLLAKSAEGRLRETISRAGGIASLLTQDGATEFIELGLECPAASSGTMNYHLRLEPSGLGYLIGLEELSKSQSDGSFRSALTGRVVESNSGGKIQESDGVYNRQETEISEVRRARKHEVEEFQRKLSSVTEIYHTLDVSARSPVRTPQSLQPADTPGQNGETLLSCLYTLREDAIDRYEAVLDALRAAFPSFEKLELPTVATGSVTLRWKDRNFTGAIYPHQLSEGTLRFLWLATLLQSPGLPKVTLIDEPEVSLHPEMLQLLAELMREATSRTQLFVATHSDRFVRFLQPSELVICDLDESGGTQVQRADRLDLGRWLAEYSLDELWNMGRLGGRS